ncbi:hypothetical protein M378DRAFT_395566 [Amanita muscaria Koide BX008]|uniref:Uncharacterized protein n=1 Tax=Amanita muscaria (strain Koide BX008) TaxID=946122 RepID=A0A0C2STF5_AMAMK|nr:hypothetical protein M378DRAFT_395566 [Amanita muscaria Koide BX008]
MGKFETFPSFNQALKGFDSAGRVGPKAVNGTFADLEFSRALQEVRVGEIVIPQGFVLKGSLNLPSVHFEASFDIEISPSRIHVDGHIKNAITVTIDNTRLFALTHASDSNRGPSLDLTIERDTPPNCYFSGEIYLLGLSAAAQFELSDDGMQFHETISAWLAGVKIDFVINTAIYLDFSASCTLDLSLPPFKIGKVDIPHIKVVKFAASLATQVHWTPITWELVVSGKMSLVDWDMGQAGPFTLGPDLSDFTKITNYLVDHVKDRFNSLFKDKVAEILAEGLKEVVNELKNVGLAAEKTTELLVKEFDCDLKEVIKQVGEIFELEKEEMAKIMKDLGTTAEKVARILKDAYSVTANSLAQILKQAGYAVDDVGRTLKDVYGIASNEIAQILKQAGYTVDDVGRVLRDVYGVTSTEIASILKQAGYTVDDIGRALKDVYGVISTEIASFLQRAGYTVQDIGRVLEGVYGETANTVASILKGAGYTVDDVGRVLKDVFHETSNEIATILKGAGYAIDDIARTLENVFNMTGGDAARVLKDIGYAMQDVDRAISDVFGAIGGAVGDAADAVGDALGDAADAVGGALGSIFG